MIYVTGDTHGLIDIRKTREWNFPEQRAMTKDDYLIICGDVGCVWDGGESDRIVRKELDGRNFTTLFVDGNHENHDMLDRYPVEMWHGGKIHRISESIIHLMRGQVYEICGKSVFAMGGAESTDINRRIKGQSWWPRELPNDEEYAEALENLRKHDFKVDYVITHCAPENTLDIDRKENRLTRFFDALITDYDLQFDEWFCGHYHRDKTIGKFSILYFRVIYLSEQSDSSCKR